MAGMQPHDVFRLTGATDPRLSPDGATVAYVVASVDEESGEPRSSIWSVQVDGSPEPRRLTFGPKRAPTDSSHGGRLGGSGPHGAAGGLRDRVRTGPPRRLGPHDDVGPLRRAVVGRRAGATDRDQRRLRPSLLVPGRKPHRRVLRSGC